MTMCNPDRGIHWFDVEDDGTIAVVCRCKRKRRSLMT